MEYDLPIVRGPIPDFLQFTGRSTRNLLQCLPRNVVGSLWSRRDQVRVLARTLGKDIWAEPLNDEPRFQALAKRMHEDAAEVRQRIEEKHAAD